MAFNPMNIPPGSGPSLEGKPNQPWYKNWLMWVVVLSVVVGAIVFAY
jgi:hypothetical protein